MHTLKLEKVINREITEVFSALKQGRLFINCSADSNDIEIDFRVGGKYQIHFKPMGKYNRGEFLEIIPNKKIVFSWCQSFESPSPDTRVTIELFSEDNKTRVVLEHSGFKTKETCDNHFQGWTSGLNDLSVEMQTGKLRMFRKFSAPVEKLFSLCQNPETFFGTMGDLSHGTVDFKIGGHYQVPNQKGGVKGDFLEIIPNQRISFTWLSGCGEIMKGSKVTLNFGTKDGSSTLELIHEGLANEEAQISHRRGWDAVTSRLRDLV
jgi:uncharacterized protein YndB with AHSA1/START domain